jgi:hypothetical protein
MYANLMVKIGERDGASVDVYAHKVIVRSDRIYVHIDEQDGSGNHAEPAGVLTLPVGTELTIYPDY